MESKKVKHVEKENTMVVARDLGGGGGMLVKGYKLSVTR